MRPPIFTSPVQFYAPPELVAAARNKALREGRTLSEVLRSALRREVG